MSRSLRPEKPRQEIIEFESDASSAKSDAKAPLARRIPLRPIKRCFLKLTATRKPRTFTKLRMAIEAGESADEKAGKASEDADAPSGNLRMRKSSSRRRSARSREGENRI